ncbi:MAG: hypothetical protein H7239_08615 [Flavobacterium sp.]|nr:hypothetical protein [Flavobacterium sp.]
MKNFFYFLLLGIFAISCNENRTVTLSEKITNDSISYYLTNSKNENFNSDQKLHFCNRAFFLVKNAKNNLQYKNNLPELISCFYSLQDYDKFNTTASLFYKLSKKSKDSISIANSLRYKGIFFYQKQNLDSSYYYFSKAEKLHLKLHDNTSYAFDLFKKGIVQYDGNDFLGATISFTKSLAIYKANNDSQKIYSIYSFLGITSLELKEYQNAIDYHNLALKEVEEGKLNSEEHQKSICYNNIGMIYLNLKDYKKSKIYFNLALNDKLVRKEAPILYSNLVDNLAYSKFKSNDYQNLPQLYFHSLNIRDSIKEASNLIASYNHLSEYYAKLNDTIQSLKFSNKSLVIANQSKSPVNLLSALKQISLIDLKNSSKYSARYIRINDSLQDIERRNRNVFGRIELETDEIKRDRDEIIVSNKNLTFYLVSSFGFLLLLFSARIYKSSRRLGILEKLQKDAGQEMFNLILLQQTKVEEGRIQEKNRIAKEIHDGILGRLFGLRMNLDGLNHRSDEEARHERIDCVEKLKSIESDVREISHELSREKFVLISNFVSIVNQLFDDQRKINVAVLNTSISEAIDWDNILSITKINLYRILQECFQNINKYAEAKTITVLFRKDKKGNLTLTITDDGIGFDVEKNSDGIGINNIITRVSECQGTTEIASEKDKGTRYSIVVPMDHKIVKI